MCEEAHMSPHAYPGVSTADLDLDVTADVEAL